MKDRYRLLQEMVLIREDGSITSLPIGTEVSKEIMETVYKGSSCV
jgi:hypothetical protein